MEHIKVSSVSEAWRAAARIFPTDQQSPRQRPDGDRRSDDGKPKDSVGIP